MLVCFEFFQESYIIDNGSAGIWAWIGKKSSKKERSEAMRNALVSMNDGGADKNSKT